MADLASIPGIGKTFVKDFARIGVTRTSELRGRDPAALFDELVRANERERHATSKNYFYVIRMAVYYANGGRDPEKLRWNAWTDAKLRAAAPSNATKRATKKKLATKTTRATKSRASRPSA
jgi:hypothetical protein